MALTYMPEKESWPGMHKDLTIGMFDAMPLKMNVIPGVHLVSSNRKYNSNYILKGSEIVQTFTIAVYELSFSHQ
jgi:hypothetical protein